LEFGCRLGLDFKEFRKGLERRGTRREGDVLWEEAARTFISRFVFIADAAELYLW
jgi:hypothetical protein